MAKTLTQRNILIAVASFILIWFVVVKQKVSEHMTGAARASDADKKAITDTIIQTIIPPPKGTEAPKLSAEAKKQLAFLEQNPLTAIDDKFMSSLTELAKKMAQNDMFTSKLLEDPDFVKKSARSVGQLVVANVIWLYADSYEKLKEAPSQSEFKEQMTKLISENPMFEPIIRDLKNRLNNESWFKSYLERSEKMLKDPNADEMNKKWASQDVEFNKTQLQTISLQKAALGPNNYPLSGSASPLVNQIFDIAYKYYFGEVVSTSNIASGAWTAIVATVGSIGAIAIVAAIVYFVFLR